MSDLHAAGSCSLSIPYKGTLDANTLVHKSYRVGTTPVVGHDLFMPLCLRTSRESSAKDSRTLKSQSGDTS